MNRTNAVIKATRVRGAWSWWTSLRSSEPRSRRTLRWRHGGVEDDQQTQIELFQFIDAVSAQAVATGGHMTTFPCSAGQTS
jgi:hypothetical protein